MAKTQTASAAAAVAEKLPSLVVDSQKLFTTLNKIASIITSNPIVPVLENFLFNLKGNELLIRASDLRTDAQITLEVESTHTLDFTVPAKIFLEILKSLPAQVIRLELDMSHFGCTIYALEGHYKVQGDNPVDFPKRAELGMPAEIKFEANVFRTALAATLFACSGDELRPAMTGVKLEANEAGTVFCATDGHRLVTYAFPDMPDLFGLILPAPALKLVERLLPEEGDVVIAHNSAVAKVSFSNLAIVIRLIDERYPDYRNAIPKNNPYCFLINRSALLASLRRVAIFAGSEGGKRVRLSFHDDLLMIQTYTWDNSKEAKESLNCKPEDSLNVQSLEFGFDPKYLIECLVKLPYEEIRLEASSPNRAVLLLPQQQPEGCLHMQLVMPAML